MYCRIIITQKMNSFFHYPDPRGDCVAYAKNICAWDCEDIRDVFLLLKRLYRTLNDNPTVWGEIQEDLQTDVPTAATGDIGIKGFLILDKRGFYLDEKLRIRHLLDDEDDEGRKIYRQLMSAHDNSSSESPGNCCEDPL